MKYNYGDFVRSGTYVYYCNETACTGPIGSQWTVFQSGEVCPQQFPDPVSGKCEASSDPLCINPCIRLANGQLVVNKDTAQCRVFTTTTDGSGGQNQPCPTVCPQACVEMWETCPPGTGIVSTLATNTVTDLLSLTSPILLDGSPNSLWPQTYSGTPYNECYSFNTRLCDMAMAKQVTYNQNPVTQAPLPQPFTLCYANCPAGTFPSVFDNNICLFNPVDLDIDPNEAYRVSGPDTSVQRVFCNPLYYNESLWGGLDAVNLSLNPEGKYPGKQKGCAIIPVPSKESTTCPAGTSSYLNEYFNLEWCLPECKTGYVLDLTQTTCISTCEGAPITSSSEFNSFIDYVDFYAMSGRCKTVNGQEVNCAQNNIPGRCPVDEREALSSSTGVSANHSENTWSASSLNPDATSPSGYGGSQALFLANLSAYQKNYSDNRGPEQTPLISCPDGMVRGNSAIKELSQFCYDTCMTGYEPSYVCPNGASQCANPQFICIAKCPGPSEGLGAWISTYYENASTCKYKYPNNNLPTDPALFVACPDDGRFITQQVLQKGTNITIPECVKTTYLRNVTCPQGFLLGPNNQCIQGCNSSETILNVGGTMVCQGPVGDTGRHEIDLIAVSDRDRSAQNFKHRVLTRKSYGRGVGTDPGAYIESSTPTKIATYASIGGVVLLTGFAAYHLLKPRPNT